MRVARCSKKLADVGMQHEVEGREWWMGQDLEQDQRYVSIRLARSAKQRACLDRRDKPETLLKPSGATGPPTSQQLPHHHQHF
jgi:hypothetical protein